MSLLIRLSNRLQVTLLQHPGFLSRLGLTLLYDLEVVIYSLSPQGFLTSRQKVLGNNFAALGKLIVGGYSDVAPGLVGQQERGAYLGRLRLIEDRFSKYFLLFMSNRPGKSDALHRQVRELLWKLVLEQAVERTSLPEARAFVRDFVAKAAKKGNPPSSLAIQKDLQRMVLQYMMLVLLEIRLDARQTDELRSLIFSFTPLTSMILSRAKPFALPWTVKTVRKREERLQQLIDQSPPLRRFDEHNPHGLDRQAFVAALAQMIAIAGCQGGYTLTSHLVTKVPVDLPIDLEDSEAVRLVVLESARRNSPVNNVNVIATEAMTVKITDREETFPAGTVVALSIGIASLDPGTFSEPLAFRPDRPNLCPAMLNFNAIGDQGPRRCPGRGVAEALGVDLLTTWRRQVAGGPA